MKYGDILKRCKGRTVVINNGEERTLLDVEEDFIILQGGNPQMRLTEFVPVAHIVKVMRADYTSTGESSISLDLTISGADQKRGGH